MLLSFEQIAKLNGFNVKHFEADNFKKGIRHSGRTTKILLEVVEASQYGQVLIKGYNSKDTYDLWQTAQKYAISAGLNPLNISMSTFVNQEIKAKVIHDHYAPELLKEFNVEFL